MIHLTWQRVKARELPTRPTSAPEHRTVGDAQAAALSWRWKGVTLGSVFPEVLVAAQAGSEWAWERLFASVAATVRGYLVAQGATDADDLTGEVMLQLVGGLGRFAGDEAGFRSWVFLIAHHRLIDEQRRRGREATWASRRQPMAFAPGAETEAIDRLAHGEWGRRLARLSEDQRAVVLLRVVADLSADEVGHILGKRPGTVRILQHRALARLRADLVAGVTL